MMKREFELPVERCPFCGSAGTCKFKGMIHDIPYFGETMETLIWCEKCKFRHADVMHLGEREPRRYEYEVTSADDMEVRVVRSSTGFLEIPELEVSIRPGPRSEGFVSNIEGVLERVKGAIETAKKEASPEGRAEAERKLGLLEKVRQGKFRATIILSDPNGHSAIVHANARKRKLTENEMKKIT